MRLALKGGEPVRSPRKPWPPWPRITERAVELAVPGMTWQATATAYASKQSKRLRPSIVFPSFLAALCGAACDQRGDSPGDGLDRYPTATLP